MQEKLATVWNKFNYDLAAAETQLAEFEDQASRIDKTVRSKQQLLENGNQIQVSRWLALSDTTRGLHGIWSICIMSAIKRIANME